MAKAAKAACEYLPFGKLNKYSCQFGSDCYRTNPHHLFHGHDMEHIAIQKPSSITQGRNTKALFHQTSPENMANIYINGPKFLLRWHQSSQPGVKYLFGQGIYFTTSISATYAKASHHGCIFCGEFDLGKVLETANACPESTPQKIQAAGYDTLFAPKGIIKDYNQKPLANDEYIITDLYRQFIRGCWLFLDEDSEQKFFQATKDLKLEID
eukprot:288013_1